MKQLLLLSPIFSVKATVLDCLCNVLWLYRFASVKVSDGSCDTDNSVISSCGKTDCRKRAAQKCKRSFADFKKLVGRAGTYLGIAINTLYALKPL